MLGALRASGAPAGVQDIAERVGLHPNTVRFHLDGLVAGGFAKRQAEGRTQPGRPRAVYLAAAADAPVGQRSYRLLAEMLTSVVLDILPEPGEAAETTGEAWGHYLAERPAPSRRVDAAEGVRRLSTVLADAGFAPDTVDRGDWPVIALRHCPFGEVAEQHQNVVCSLHLGLLRGVLSEVRAPLLADRLEPFAEPSLCMAYLKPVSGDAARTGRGPGHDADRRSGSGR
ncbi:helix-turn-helix transcriptional regulator [Amycolatopsis echigonensis]|uniref:helix-turn-helix transcriptional regulator n=1 Tax=Amycolatopsis echigonensis TaxID=2576905 RepID=UPI000C6FFAD9|nr:helix-turn-helix domain-containing protein [Amycolatopsis niigatensis]